jgi:hypothetical protein
MQAYLACACSTIYPITESATATIESRDFERTASPFKRCFFSGVLSVKGRSALWDDPGYVDLPQKKTLQPNLERLRRLCVGKENGCQPLVPSRHRDIHQTIALVQSMRCPEERDRWRVKGQRRRSTRRPPGALRRLWTAASSKTRHRRFLEVSRPCRLLNLFHVRCSSFSARIANSTAFLRRSPGSSMALRLSARRWRSFIRTRSAVRMAAISSSVRLIRLAIM